MTDRELLVRHLGGDREGMEALVRRHIDMVYAAARRQVGETLADDVTQAVFLMLMRKGASLRGRESLAGWLYRAAGYCCANVRKTEARRRKHEREVVTMTEPETNLSTAEMRELLELLDAGLGGLSKSDREAILLRHLGQASYAEAAVNLGITEEAARKRADRGLGRLREFFVRRGFNVPVESVATVMARQAGEKAPAAVVGATLALTHAAAIPATVAAMAKSIASMFWWSQAKVVGSVAAVVAAVAVTVPLLSAGGQTRPVAVVPATRPVAATAPATTKVAATPTPGLLDLAKYPAMSGVTYTHVTVDFDDSTPDDAAKVFGKATGLTVKFDLTNLEVEGIKLPPLTMHLHDVPLLQAIFQLARITQSYPTELSAGKLSLRAATDDTQNNQANIGVWNVAGPFGVEVAKLERSPTRGGGSDTMMSMAFFAEPGMNIIHYPNTVTVEKFIDNKEQAVSIGRGRGMGRAGSGTSRAPMTLPLVLPATPARRIATFSGTAEYVMAGKSEIIETAGPEETFTKHVGEMDIEVLPLERREPTAAGATIPTFHIKIRYRRGTMNAASFAELTPMFQLYPPTAYDVANRSRKANPSGRPVMEGEDAVLLDFAAAGASPNAPKNSNLPGNPTHFVLEVPLSVRTVAVPFEFHNISLP